MPMMKRFRSVLQSKLSRQKQKPLAAQPEVVAKEAKVATTDTSVVATTDAVVAADISVAAADATVAAVLPAQMTITVQNRFPSGTVFAYVTGQALDNGNKVCMIKADGKTPYFPPTPSQVGTAIADNVSIKLGGTGSTTNITIPQLAGGRLWFSVDKELTFLLNPGGNGPALVEPSISNPSDPNININWGFCEFTFANGVIYANISYVDFVSIPIGMTLTPTNGGVQAVAGLKPGGLDYVCDGLESQKNTDWGKLVYKANGKRLRALSPNNGIVMHAGKIFVGYYVPYINQVWEKYANADLTVDTQAQWGVVKGRVSNGHLVFPGASFAKPQTRDVFSNSSGPFADNTGILGPLTARLAAAFNRSTLLINDVQPTNENRATFYTNPVTNHFSRLVHEANIDGRGYAFPYDDVPAGNVDQSGFVNGLPQTFVVSVG